MAQNNLHRYPDRIMFSDIPSAADLQSNFPSRLLSIVMQWVNEHDLPIYTNKVLHGVDVSNEIEELYDDDGQIRGLLVAVGQSDTLDGAQDELIIEYGTYLPSANTIAVSRIKCNGTSYYPSDESGMMVQFLNLDLDDCFCKRSELKTFLDKLDSRDEPGTIKRPAKKCRMQEKREIAFKTWLATKANTDVANDFYYQKYYKAIGEPTQKDTWIMLQQIDRRLFSTGKDDFFKKQNIISFKEGTGKRRNHK